jgi:hypothetical protein
MLLLPCLALTCLAWKGPAMSSFLVGLATFGGLLAAAAPTPEPFAIDLEVRAGNGSKIAHAESAAPGARPKQRQVLEVQAGEPITVRWKLRSTAPKATLKDVTIHFFAVKEERAGQQMVPPLNRDVVAETALLMDFGPKDKNEGTLRFTIHKAGTYLFRLETIGATAGPAGHEDFAALDVKAR